MSAIISALAKGDENFASQFSTAVTAWRAFHEANAGLSEQALAAKLGSEQFRHEQHFDGDRHLGKMTMPMVALAALDDDAEGFGERREYAVRLARAFLSSSVSVEVKGSALVDAIIMHDLEDEPGLREFVKQRLRF